MDGGTEYYWEIIERDGTVTRIPPGRREVVQRRLGNGDPIHTRTRSIPANQIVSFRITGERYSDIPLIEAAAQAFKEPLYSKVEGLAGEYEAIKGRWVKKPVPMERWQRYYSEIPGYKLLGELNGMAMIAFVVATHDIDINKVDYCSETEIYQLTR